MNKFQQILNSFSVQETLNPKIWQNPDDPQKSKMIPKVKNALMRIAEEFIEYLGEEVFVEDIVLTGSLANFNWSGCRGYQGCKIYQEKPTWYQRSKSSDWFIRFLGFNWCR